MNPFANKTDAEREAMRLKSAETRRRNREDKQAKKDAALAARDTLLLEIKELEKKLQEMRAFHAASQSASLLTGRFLLHPSEIIKSSRPYERRPGVYFLIRGEEIVYVGQSVNVHARIWQHEYSKRGIDSFAYVECEKDVLDQLESIYIHTLRPAMNGLQCDGEMLAPIHRKDIVGLRTAAQA